MAHIRVGTSGYVYRDWRGLLYQPGLPPARWLEQYARVFSTVELNTTFYGLPRASSVDRWRDQTPPGFRFAAKGSRYVTHQKRLLDPADGVGRFFEVVGRLGEKLEVVLWQLPPGMSRPDLPRLERFLGALPRSVRHAVEFRAEAWHQSREVLDLLDAYDAAVVEHDLVGAPPPRPTGGFRYRRFHGATGKYHGRYGAQALRPFARELRASARRGHDAYVYFNNDFGGAALSDALDLADLLGDPAPREAYREVAPPSGGAGSAR